VNPFGSVMSESLLLERPHGVDAPTPRKRTIRIALAGCGTVGGALLQLLRERAGAIEATHGLHAEVVGILVRDASRPRAPGVASDLITDDVDAFLAVDCDVVIEAIGGLEPAHRIACHALAAGRSFITANKALVAAHGEELERIARERNASFFYEAAVAGGVPVVRVLRDSLPHTGIRSIRGILNGTTNYILTRMGDGVSLAAALAEAQAQGFAEADPSRDLDGRDAADKIAILAWQAFGISPSALQVERTGLLPEPEEIVRTADAFGGTVRLVAECLRTPGGVTASVEPVVVAWDSEFARTPAEENLVVIETEAAGTIRLSGPGAGGSATASAILADLLHAAAGRPAPAGTAPDRAPASSTFRNTPDPRRHRWAIRVEGTREIRAAAQFAAERVGIELYEPVGAWRHGAYHALTPPISRTLAGVLARALEAAGARAVVLRYVVEGVGRRD
jgi:homoserine dehydrogenase